MQIWQCPHVFVQLATCVHGWQRVGSASAAPSVQVPGWFDAGAEPRNTGVGAPGMTQHPKQSQPFGTSAPQ